MNRNLSCASVCIDEASLSKQSLPLLIMQLHAEVESRLESLVTIRRHLHAHPELSLQEFKTSAFIAEKLREIGVEKVQVGVGRPTAIVGLINGDHSGPCIALRADMDALPIQENAQVPHASKNNGVMHACGHDGYSFQNCVAKMSV
jgi:amidohydrolase